VAKHVLLLEDDALGVEEVGSKNAIVAATISASDGRAGSTDEPLVKRACERGGRNIYAKGIDRTVRLHSKIVK